MNNPESGSSSFLGGETTRERRVVRFAASALYLATAIATAIPVIRLLGWAVWGAGTSLTEYLSLLGSLILVISALMSPTNRRFAARFALAGVTLIWSFYLPTLVRIARTSLSDQELGLSVLLWNPSASPLIIRERGLFPVELQLIKDSGITGMLSVLAARGLYGSGKKSHVTLIMQRPVHTAIELKEPDATDVVYVQYGDNWKIYPSNARTLERTIRIEPEAGDPRQSSVMVELAGGARQGFGVSWPKLNLEGPDR